MSLITIGIDPGKTGAIAAVMGEDLMWIEDLPVIDGRLAPALLDKLYLSNLYGPWHMEPGSTPVAIEQVHAMPKQGVTSVFSLGANYGALLGYFTAHHHRITEITPTEWKATFRLNGIGKGLAPAAAKRARKDASLARAVALWPAHAELFARKGDDGRAEAALLALHHARTLRHTAAV